jgi:PPOX class probable F420-dependent enzyme
MQEYGISSEAEGLLPWSFATQQLTLARNYWIGSTRPDGRPHAAPVWGVWLDEVLYFGTGPGSVKARNLRANPALVVHLESGDDVVILEGTAEWLTQMDAELWQRIADQYAAKYEGFRPDPPSTQGPFVALRPSVALAWQEQDFVRSATRWSFDHGQD